MIVCMGMGEQPEDEEDAVELTRVVVSLVDSDWGERMMGTALSGLSELWQPASQKRNTNLKQVLLVAWVKWCYA